MSNYLKKQFKEKDVNRLRNLLSKKGNESAVSGVGFTKETVEHAEGDVWEENGKKWTIKDGIKQNITKLSKIKDLVILPLLCPNCSHQMKHKLDKKFYNIHKMCFDCVIKMETKLRATGQYEEYEKSIVNRNVKSFIKEAKDFVSNMSNEVNDAYITEQGDVEKWSGGENLVEEKKKKMLEELDIFEQQIIS